MSWIGSAGVPFEDVGMTEEKYKLLEVLAKDDKYWRNAQSFLRQVEGVRISTLTLRQRNWIYDIEASLGVELNRRAAKEVFEEQH